MAKLFGSTIKVASVYWSTADKDVLNKLKVQMKQVSDFIKKEKIKCTTKIIEKKGNEKTLAPLILDYAKQEKDIDLIMIMTQTEAGLFDLFLGSSAQHIINHSEVPVMSIIPKELGFASMIN
jgi:nucleotide-binding universal stress UspA family protein